MILKNIILEKEQIDLLNILVEAARNVSHDERDKFRVFETATDDFLWHPGIGKKIKIYMGDLEMLDRKDLISLQKLYKKMPNFDVTPEGFRYYEYLKTKDDISIENIEKTFIEYIKKDNFIKEYNLAFQKMNFYI